MSDQSLQNHTYRPTHTTVAGLFAMAALVLQVMAMRGGDTGGWAVIFAVLAVFTLTLISRTYTVRLQDRIIMLETKVRAAELLAAGQDSQLTKLSVKQITALRFASDEEFGGLLDRAVRENLAPKDIKAAIKTWRPDLYRT